MMRGSGVFVAVMQLVTAASLMVAATSPAAAGKPAGVDPLAASSWEIGPILSGRNYSLNMPNSPSPHPDGWFFDFPQPDAAAGHVHYVTYRHGSLKGKSGIVLRYRIEADASVQFVPKDTPAAPSTLTLYFQRRGDTWSGKGKYEHYRWWATFRLHEPLAPGQHELAVRFDENWTSVMGSSAASNPAAFREALMNADRVGFTFGGGGLAGHGVYATGPARFVLTGFDVTADGTDFAIRTSPAN